MKSRTKEQGKEGPLQMENTLAPNSYKYRISCFPFTSLEIHADILATQREDFVLSSPALKKKPCAD
jgi:hypothetical protein